MGTSKNKNLHPESLVISGLYNPDEHLGSIKPPIFQTSTFRFKTAEIGQISFKLAYGKKLTSEEEEICKNEKIEGIYSRLNNPNFKILEEKLCVWDRAEDCAIFSSGMAAITSLFLNFLRPGDLLLHSIPVYGGTDHFIDKILNQYGINIIAFNSNENKEQIIKKVEASSGDLKMIYIETPANPTNTLIDLEVCKDIRNHFLIDDDKSDKENEVLLVVDNTYMGPIWSQPIKLGADLVVYSATKYIAGHSDLIAGACLGKAKLIEKMKVFRTFSGNMPTPWTCWLMTRSLETLKIRMEQQAKSAEIIAKKLSNHKNIEKVYYLGLLKEEDPQYVIYKKQYSSPGAMISFDVKGGKDDAFKVLNNLQLINLAVSLGGTESLIEHPYRMTHADVSEERKEELDFTEKLIRLSIGLENVEDIWFDLNQSLNLISKK